MGMTIMKIVVHIMQNVINLLLTFTNILLFGYVAYTVLFAQRIDVSFCVYFLIFEIFLLVGYHIAGGIETSYEEYCCDNYDDEEEYDDDEIKESWETIAIICSGFLLF